MKKIILIVAILAVAGCKAPPTAPIYSLLTLPEVGKTVTVGIGEQMLTQGDGATVEGLVLSKNLTFKDITVFAGSYPRASGNDEYRAFVPVVMSRAGRAFNGKLFLFNKDVRTKLVCIGRNNCVETDYKIDGITTYSPSRSQQTLLYSGRIGTRVTLSYREFINDMARPAFSNDVAYDLDESTVLGYKGARIEVIKATNTEITYRVVAGFK